MIFSSVMQISDFTSVYLTQSLFYDTTRSLPGLPTQQITPRSSSPLIKTGNSVDPTSCICPFAHIRRESSLIR